MDTLCFLSGLPRSGSTWLASILNQNPDVYVTPQSPFVEILWRNYSIWNDIHSDENMASDKIRNMKIPYLRDLTTLYYKHLTDCSIVIDKRPSWQTITNIEMYKNIFGKLPKIICAVRNVEEIAASFDFLFRNNGKDWHVDDMKEVLLQNCLSLKSTFNSQYKECLLFVDYENLVNDTPKELERIYKFIDVPLYTHELDSVDVDVSYKKVEDVFGVKGMHTVRKGVSRSKIIPENILVKEGLSFYRGLTFWDKTL